MIEEHSKLFGFSSAHRWTGNHCPGSVGMCLDEEDPDTEASMEGTAAHYVAETMLQQFKQRVDSNGIPAGEALIGQQAPNGIIIIEEMFDAALVYYLKVTEVVGTDVERKANLRIEKRVYAPSIDEEAWGTADAVFWWPNTNTLVIWDLKYGHKSVDAHENEQLVGYAQATAETFQIDTLNPRLCLNIVQPRCYDGKGALRQWNTCLDNIRAHVNHLRHAANLHREGKAMCRSGEWCYKCPARGKCTALTGASTVAVDYSAAPVKLNMSPVALGYELELVEKALDRLEQRHEAILAEAEKRVRGGELIPGRRMEDKLGNKKWNKEVDPAMLGSLFGCDFMKPAPPKTPTQAITELRKKGLDESVISTYYHTPKAGVKLVADDGTRTKQLFSGEHL